MEILPVGCLALGLLLMLIDLGIVSYPPSPHRNFSWAFIFGLTQTYPLKMSVTTLLAGVLARLAFPRAQAILRPEASEPPLLRGRSAELYGSGPRVYYIVVL